ELCRLLASGLTHGLEDACLGHTAKIVIDRWRPASRCDVEVRGFCDAVCVSQRAGTVIPGLIHGIDAQSAAMREQRVTTIDVELEQRVPQFVRPLRQLLGPFPMSIVDGLCDSAVIETGCLAGQNDAFGIDLKTGI